MEQILINLVAGALGGVGAGKSSPTFDLGTVGNIVSGLVGGGVLGQVVSLLLPSVVAAAESGNMSVSGIVSQVVAGAGRTCLVRLDPDQEANAKRPGACASVLADDVRTFEFPT